MKIQVRLTERIFPMTVNEWMLLVVTIVMTLLGLAMSQLMPLALMLWTLESVTSIDVIVFPDLKEDVE